MNESSPPPFWSFENSAEGVGVFPQITQIITEHTSPRGEPVPAYVRDSKLSDFDWDRHMFATNGRARLTDIFSGPVYFSITEGFVLSDRARLVFEAHALGASRLSPVRLLHRRKILGNYWLLQVDSSAVSWIDWSRSSFVIQDFFCTRTIESCSVDSHDAFVALREKTWARAAGMNETLRIDPEVLCLMEERSGECDLFTLGGITSSIHISDRLAQALSAAAITGFRLYPSRYLSVIPCSE